MTVIVPSPADANAKPSPRSNAVASQPSPMAGLATTLPLSASTIAIFLLLQPANRRRVFRSIDSPVGSSQSVSFQRDFTTSLTGSNATISDLSSIFTNTVPFSSVAANSGLPPSSILPTTSPLDASIAVADLSDPLPLKVNTRFEKG